MVFDGTVAWEKIRSVHKVHGYDVGVCECGVWYYKIQLMCVMLGVAVCPSLEMFIPGGRGRCSRSSVVR